MLSQKNGDGIFESLGNNWRFSTGGKEFMVRKEELWVRNEPWRVTDVNQGQLMSSTWTSTTSFVAEQLVRGSLESNIQPRRGMDEATHPYGY